MTHLALYAVALPLFLMIDIIWLKKVAAPMFRRHVGALMRDEPDLRVAGLFYAAYVGFIVYFAAAPALASGGGVAQAALDGALVGLLAYGTYEATNLSTLKGWTMGMALTDTLWGGFVSAVTAAGAVLVIG